MKLQLECFQNLIFLGVFLPPNRRLHSEARLRIGTNCCPKVSERFTICNFTLLQPQLMQCGFENISFAIALSTLVSSALLFFGLRLSRCWHTKRFCDSVRVFIYVSQGHSAIHFWVKRDKVLAQFNKTLFMMVGCN